MPFPILPAAVVAAGLAALHSGEDEPAALTEADLARSPGGRYLLGLQAASSRATQARALRSAAELIGRPGSIADSVAIPWHLLSVEELLALRTRLGEHRAPGTANRVLCAVRGSLKAAWLAGEVDQRDYAQRLDAIRSVRGSRAKKGRMLTDDEVERLRAAARNQPTPRKERDSLIVILALWAGLRRSEIVELPVGAYNRGTRLLTVMGKGNKERQIPWPADAEGILNDWLRLRLSLVEAGEVQAPLLLRIERGGKFRRHLNPTAVRSILLELATEADIKDFSPHDCRRTFISILFAMKEPLPTIMALAGHAQASTTVLYDQGGLTAARDAIDAMSRRRSGLVEVPEEAEPLIDEVLREQADEEEADELPEEAPEVVAPKKPKSEKPSEPEVEDAWPMDPDVSLENRWEDMESASEDLGFEEGRALRERIRLEKEAAAANATHDEKLATERAAHERQKNLDLLRRKRGFRGMRGMRRDKTRDPV